MVGWQRRRWSQIGRGTSDVTLLEPLRAEPVRNIRWLQLTEMKMNDDVPFIWRKNYRNETASPERMLEIAHEKARQYLSRAAEVDATKSLR
jgi:hypothetical protein